MHYDESRKLIADILHLSIYVKWGRYDGIIIYTYVYMYIYLYMYKYIYIFFNIWTEDLLSCCQNVTHQSTAVIPDIGISQQKNKQIVTQIFYLHTIANKKWYNKCKSSKSFMPLYGCLTQFKWNQISDNLKNFKKEIVRSWWEHLTKTNAENVIFFILHKAKIS